MRTLVVSTGAVVVAAIAAIPYVCGRMLEGEVRNAIDAYNKGQTFVTASVVRYDRQWLRSEFVTRFAVRDGPELARASTSFRHAPFSGLSFASGESEVHFPESLAATEQYYFDGQVPLRLSLDVDLAGRASGTIKSAAVDKAIIANPKTRVVAGASAGTFSIAKDKSFKLDWSLPKVSFEDPAFSVAVEGLAVAAYGQFGDDDLSEPSGFKIAVASYRGVYGTRRASVRNVSLSTQMIPTAETLKFALAVRAGSGDVAFDASRHAWESFELAASLSDVQRAPVVRYSAEVRRISDVDVSESQKVTLAMRALSDLAAGLAEGEPVFAVDRLELRTAQGNLAVSLRAGVDKARLAVNASTWSMADGFVMSGRASISRGLAVHLASDAVGGEPAAQGAIAQLVARGVVKENGDALELDIAARDGIYMVNGVRANELARM